jgi:hypothetical protein
MLNIADQRNLCKSDPVATLLRLVFLLAVKDRADQIGFEEQPDAMTLKYRVEGKWYTMVPPPAALGRQIVHRLRLWAGSPQSSPALRRTWIPWGATALRQRRQIHTGLITFRVKSTVVDARAKFFPDGDGQRVLIHLQPFGSATKTARDALAAAVERYGTETTERPNLALTDGEALLGLAAATQFVAVTALVAIRDEAESIRLQRASDGWLVQSRNCGSWRDLISVPARWAQPIESEIRRLAMITESPPTKRSRWLRLLQGKSHRPRPCERDGFILTQLASVPGGIKIVVSRDSQEIWLEPTFENTEQDLAKLARNVLTTLRPRLVSEPDLREVYKHLI